MLFAAGIAAAALPAIDIAPAAIGRGTITIAPARDETLPEDTSRRFDDAVRNAMLAADFTPLPAPSHSRYVAKVEVTRTSRGVVASALPASGPPLASLTGSVSLSIPPGGDRLSDLVVTKLTVTISRRSDAHVLWSGSAVTARVTGTPAGAVDLVAQTLADAVLAQYPRQAAGPVSIP